MNIAEISVKITYKVRRQSDIITTSVICDVPVEDILYDFVENYLKNNKI